MPPFFNHIVLSLDEYFVHRLRGVEGKDGNPLNEVRMIADSVMLHGGVLTVENAIKWNPETTVLGLAPGDAHRARREELHQAGGGLLRRDRSQVHLTGDPTPPR